jgi:hypothetical protein
MLCALGLIGYAIDQIGFSGPGFDIGFDLHRNILPCVK